MASKLNFRARTLDASKPMSIYFSEDLPELTDLNAINRSVPAMPSGMEKEEEAEKHLQDILESQDKPERGRDKNAGDLFIPTPEVFVADSEGYRTMYPDAFKVPRAFIHMQPFSADHDKPDYDMDDEDQNFLDKVLREQKKFEVTELTFEDMLDKLEKHSGHSVVSPKEAKLLLKEDDELILAVYDYWVDKRLRLKQPLIPLVKSDKRDGSGAGAAVGGGGAGGGGGGGGAASSTASSNPYIAFRRRTEKMQTRKNRKNDETSYSNMLKLRRDLQRAVCLLEMIKRREKLKKENLNLTTDILEKRYTAGDWDGKVMADVMQSYRHIPANVGHARILQPAAYLKYDNWINSQRYDESGVKKRPYNKKKKYKSTKGHRANGADYNAQLLGASSDDDRMTTQSASDLDEEEAEGPFAFKRKKNCQYLAPLLDDEGRQVHRGWPWEGEEEGGTQEPKYRYSLASLSTPSSKCVGFIRRRIGRGGRTVLDRAYANYDDLWRSLDFTVTTGRGRGGEREASPPAEEAETSFEDYPHYRPVTPPHCRDDSDWDPYKVRLLESPVGLPTQPIRPPPSLQRSRSIGMNNGPLSTASMVAAAAAAAAASQQQLPPTLRTVSVDSVIAHNAASAVVNSDTLDLFSGLRSTNSSK